MPTTRRFLIALCNPFLAIALLVTATASLAAQATTTQQSGAATSTTEQLNGEVVRVDGNDLVVRMSNGELRTFSDVPDTRRATIDGKEVGVRDLQPGTRLTATITRTNTPVTTRTATVGTGTVVYVLGTTVILRLPSGEVKQYIVRPEYQFVVNGKPSTVADLRQGMTVSAERIVEETTVVFATNTTVTGQGPAAQAGAQGAPAAATAQGARGQAGAAPAAGGQTTGGAAGGGAQAPAQLPKTASELPFVGLLGVFLVGSALVVRRLRRA